MNETTPTPPPAGTVYAVLRNGTESQRKCADPVKFLSINIHPSLWDLYTFRDPSGKVWRVEAGRPLGSKDVLQKGDQTAQYQLGWIRVSPHSFGRLLQGNEYAAYRRPAHLVFVPAEPIQPKPEIENQCPTPKSGIVCSVIQTITPTPSVQQEAMVTESCAPVKSAMNDTAPPMGASDGTEKNQSELVASNLPGAVPPCAVADTPIADNLLLNHRDNYPPRGGFLKAIEEIRTLERQTAQLSTDLAHEKANAQRLEKERDEERKEKIHAKDYLADLGNVLGQKENETVFQAAKRTSSATARAEQATGLLSLWLNPPDNTLPFGKTRAFLATPDSQATLTLEERLEKVESAKRSLHIKLIGLLHTYGAGETEDHDGDNIAQMVTRIISERDALQAKVRELETKIEANDDFMGFMSVALSELKCCCREGDHGSTPPMMWPELIGCIVRRAVKDAAPPADSILVPRARLEEMERTFDFGFAYTRALTIIRELLAPTGDRKV